MPKHKRAHDEDDASLSRSPYPHDDSADMLCSCSQQARARQRVLDLIRGNRTPRFANSVGTSSATCSPPIHAVCLLADCRRRAAHARGTCSGLRCRLGIMRGLPWRCWQSEMGIGDGAARFACSEKHGTVSQRDRVCAAGADAPTVEHHVHERRRGSQPVDRTPRSGPRRGCCGI